MARRIDRLEAELTARESGVRHLAAERGVEVGKVKDYALGVLVRHCGDAELAADGVADRDRRRAVSVGLAFGCGVLVGVIVGLLVIGAAAASR
jgi:hypothetical protein